MTPLRIDVHVQPGAKQSHVGGRHGSALHVRVRAPALEGRASADVLRTLADAFGVRPGALRLVRGATSRHKVIEIDGDERALRARYDELVGPES